MKKHNSVKGKILYGPTVRPFNPDPHNITPDSAKLRQSALVEQYLSGPRTEERSKALAHALSSENPGWRTALIDLEIARQPSDPRLLVEGILLWTGSVRYWIHDIWSILPKKQKFPDFMRTFRKSDGTEFSKSEIESTRKHATGDRTNKLPENMAEYIGRFIL